MGRLSRQLLWALPLVFLTGTLQRTTLRHKLRLDSVDADALSVAGSLTVGTPIAPEYLGTGARSVDVFLRGDGVWAEPPAQYAANLQAGSTVTSSTTYVDAGGPATLLVVGIGHEVTIWLMGVLTKTAGGQALQRCNVRVLNVTTSTTVALPPTAYSNRSARDHYLAYEGVDTSPVVGANIYQIQIRRNFSSPFVTCQWDASVRGGSRGLSAFLS